MSCQSGILSEHEPCGRNMNKIPIKTITIRQLIAYQTYRLVVPV